MTRIAITLRTFIAYPVSLAARFVLWIASAVSFAGRCLLVLSALLANGKAGAQDAWDKTR